MTFIKPGTASVLAFYYFFFQKKSRAFGLLASVVGKGSSTPTLQGSYITLRSKFLDERGFDFHNSSSSSAVLE